MKFSRCRGCDFQRTRLLLDGAKHDCRIVQFCTVAETRLSEIAWHERGQSPFTLEEHKELARAMNVGHQAARRRVENVQLPSTAEEFLLVVQAIHGWIFGPTKLLFAGRFRQPGEPGVEYGGRALDGLPRQGFEPQRIASELTALFVRDLSEQGSFERMTQDEVARRCARFLEHFFRIHPFHDGNGRVARLLIRMIARKTKRYEYALVPGHHNDCGDYARALEHAHRVLDERECGLHNARDPYGPLAKWLLGYLEDCPRGDDLAEPDDAPSWLAKEQMPVQNEPH